MFRYDMIACKRVFIILYTLTFHQNENHANCSLSRRLQVYLASDAP